MINAIIHFTCMTYLYNFVAFRYDNLLIILFLICRYNPENLRKLEEYVDMQIAENTYDLEANLAVLKL